MVSIAAASAPGLANGPVPTAGAQSDARVYAAAVVADTAELLAGIADLPLPEALIRFEAVHARLQAALAEKDRT